MFFFFSILTAFWRKNNVAIISIGYRRVLMELTDRRKTAKNLVDRRKNWKILTVSRE